jgi:chromate transport protein ChrA
MPEATQDPSQQKQNNIAALLIGVNIFLAFVYILCTPQDEDDLFKGLLRIAVMAVVLQALFVFGRKGKAPLASKIILLLFIVIAILYGAFLLYAFGLAKAFQH